jgi:predicted Zn-dependent peptidase
VTLLDPRNRFVYVMVSWVSCISWISLSGAQQPDRSSPPDIGPPPALDLPAIQKQTLSNGLAVWLVESHEVPLVQVNLLVLAGGAQDPAGRFGVASLTAAMLDEGAGGRSALEIADAVELLGAALSTGSTHDASAVRLNVPVARLADALPLMADVALRPTFPESDLERLRQERLTSLLQARDDPAAIASMAFARLVFGAHRYGTGTIGTPGTVKAFAPDDLRRFHASYYDPSNAALIVVGDVQPGAVLPLLEKHFGGWKDEERLEPAPLPPPPQLRRGQLYLVDKPGAAQSEIRIGWVGAPRSTPDYFTLQVLNTILGGSFTSRLNQNLRETHGYAYGAGSSFDMRLAPGPFVAAAAVQTDKTAPALQEFFNELRGVAKPVPAGELEKAKNYVALGFPAEFETIADVSRRIEELIVYRLPDGYFEEYVANIRAVTAADVQKAAATWIQPSKFAVVVVGDRAAIEAPVRALKLAPVQVMSVEEALGQ